MPGGSERSSSAQGEDGRPGSRPQGKFEFVVDVATSTRNEK